MLREPEYVVGKKVISKDAYVLGEVMDIRCETVKWHVTGLKVKTSKSASSSFNLGNGKSTVLLQIGNFIINDVIIVDVTNKVREKITADNPSLQSILSLSGKKVIASDGTLIGTIDCMEVDFDKWIVSSLKIKLDKTAYAALGIKKGVFAKKASGILTSHIKGTGEMIMLSLDKDAVARHLVII